VTVIFNSTPYLFIEQLSWQTATSFTRPINMLLYKLCPSTRKKSNFLKH